MFHEILGVKSFKSHQGNISVEMCGDEFFLKYALLNL